MMARLPRDMQEAIERYDGPVTRCPPGAISDLRPSGNYMWNGKLRAEGIIERADKPREVPDHLKIAAPKAPRGPAPPPGPRKTRITPEQLADMVKEGLTVSEMMKRTQMSDSYIRSMLSRAGLKAAPARRRRPAGPAPARRRGKKPSPVVAERREKLRALAEEGLTSSQAAERLGVPIQTVYTDASLLKLSFARPPRARAAGAAGSTGADKAIAKREARAERGREAVKDRRRFKTTPVPDGASRATLQPDHPAVVEGRPLFESRILDAADPATAGETVLKNGRTNSKIGGDVLVGRLKGATILTLSLAERTTCPRSCTHWRSCYGNNDPHARRWLPGPALEDRLEREIAEHCAAEAQVLVRLHYLGDFYSLDYARHWADLLLDHANLHAFGFTAHAPESEIGAHLVRMREHFGQRFSIRHSGRCAPWGSFTIDFPTEKKRLGDAVVCPEQRDAMNGTGKAKHCGNCALCWESAVPVVFVEH